MPFCFSISAIKSTKCLTTVNIAQFILGHTQGVLSFNKGKALKKKLFRRIVQVTQSTYNGLSSTATEISMKYEAIVNQSVLLLTLIVDFRSVLSTKTFIFQGFISQIKFFNNSVIKFIPLSFSTSSVIKTEQKHNRNKVS